MVEAEGRTLRRSLVASCTLPASNCLAVATSSPAVLRARRLLFELLLGRAPRSRPLRDLAKRHGVESTRFGLGADEDDCVRCGLCVRACRDKIGTAAISFAGRGQKRRVTTEFAKLSKLCIGCGTCANLCPTGAIRLEDTETERTLSMRDLTIARFELLRVAPARPPSRRGNSATGSPRASEHLPRASKGELCPECARAERADSMASGLAPVVARLP